MSLYVLRIAILASISSLCYSSIFAATTESSEAFSTQKLYSTQNSQQINSNNTDKDSLKSLRRMKDITVRPDYIEVEQLRDTKQVIVLNKQDIQQRGYTTLSDAINDIPSINVGATGTGDIDIRGQGSDQSTRNIQVMLDGAPITTMINHPLKTNYDIVPIEQVEKIEIIPGGGSVLYGSGVAGGVINITTNLRAMKVPKSTISTEYNSNGYRLGLNWGAKITNKLSVETGYTKLDRDLYFKNTYRKSDYAYIGTRYTIDKNQEITLRYSHLAEKSQYINNINLQRLEQYGKNYIPNTKTYTIGLDSNNHRIQKTVLDYLNGERKLDSFNMTYRTSIGPKWNMDAEFFYNTGYYKNSDLDYMKMNHDTKGTKLKFDYNYGTGSNLLIGFDAYRQTADLNYSDYKLTNSQRQTYRQVPMSFNYDKKTYALYVLNVFKKGKWTFTQGIRREENKWYYDKTGNNISGNGIDNRWNTATELSVGYHYNKTGSLYARWERGFTSPDGLQISDEVRINGSKHYVPTKASDEKFNLYELGWKEKLGRSTINVTLFMSSTNNQMNRFYLLGPNGLSMETQNLLQTRRYGIDILLRQRIGKWAFTEGYTYLKGHTDYNDYGHNFMIQNNQTIIDYTKSGLEKVPQHKVSLSVNYMFNKKLIGGIHYTYVGKYNNFFKEADRDKKNSLVQSRSIVDIDLHYTINKSLDVYGGITNLFNKTYFDYVGNGMSTVVPGVGRTYYGGMKYTF